MKCKRASALILSVCAVLCACSTVEPNAVTNDSGLVAAAREKYECEAVLLDLKKARGKVPTDALTLYENARGKVNAWLNGVQGKLDRLNPTESLSITEAEFYDANGKEVKALKSYLGSKGEVRWEEVLKTMNKLLDEIDRRRRLHREARIAKTKEIIAGLKWDSAPEVVKKYP